MRSDRLILLGIVLVTAACNPGPATMTAGDRERIVREVTETLSELTDAMNSHDAEAVFSFYRQDETFFYLGCTDVLFGWDTFQRMVAPYYARNVDVTFDQQILSIQTLSPDVAVVAMRGSSTDQDGLFWTEVLQRGQDGRWLITYEHESWPDCSAPRGPHLGTEAMGEMQEISGTPDDPGAGGPH